MKRALVIVLDSVGIGEMEDSAEFGDTGSNTLGHVAEGTPGFALPHMGALGLGLIEPLTGVPALENPQGGYGKMQEVSKGKDTTTGHWEMMGVISSTPFKTYPQGFPASVINAFEQAIGRKSLGNVVASGTVIIEELGAEHMDTGYPIVYTSADSVLQIAAHEEVIPLEQLYNFCRQAREIMQGEETVARVIARPFVGVPGKFVRTPHRHDFSVAPPENYLDLLLKAGCPVVGVGKIFDIFAGRGLSESHATKNNLDGVETIIRQLAVHQEGLIFANLVDFDQEYGHRNDVIGYGRALMEFDAVLPKIMQILTGDDLLIITADHGCDPSTPSTDHSREFVPLLAWSPRMKKGVNLGLRNTFADVGKTLADYFSVPAVLPGISFWPELKL